MQKIEEDQKIAEFLLPHANPKKWAFQKSLLTQISTKNIKTMPEFLEVLKKLYFDCISSGATSKTNFSIIPYFKNCYIFRSFYQKLI